MSVEIFWYFLTGAAFLVFSFLDGFDMGVAMLIPFFPGNTTTRKLAIESIWPVWDGNELWGLLGAGALLVIFPQVFTMIMAGLYPLMILLIMALVFRPLGFELSYHSGGSDKTWLLMFGATGFLVAFIFGMILGNTIHGYNLLSDGTIKGGFLTLFNPFALISGLLFVSMFLVQGGAWLRVKLEDNAFAEADKLLKKVWMLPIIFMLIWIALSSSFTESYKNPLFWMFSLLFIVGYLIIAILLGKKMSANNPVYILICSVFSITMWWLTSVSIQFPVLIRSRIVNSPNLTALNSGTSLGTANLLAWIVPVVLLIVIGYSFFVYHIFKGKVKK